MATITVLRFSPASRMREIRRGPLSAMLPESNRTTSGFAVETFSKAEGEKGIAPATTIPSFFRRTRTKASRSRQFSARKKTTIRSRDNSTLLVVSPVYVRAPSSHVIVERIIPQLVAFLSDLMSTALRTRIGTAILNAAVRLCSPLNMVLEYAIESCPSVRKEVEVFREDYARETSASFGCKPSTTDARPRPGRDRRPA